MSFTLQPPATFQAFNATQSLSPRFLSAKECRLPHITADPLHSSEAERLFSPHDSLTSKKALGLFMAGVAASYGTKWILKSLFQSPKLHIMPSTPMKTDKQNILLLFDGLTSLIRIAHEQPEQRRTLLAYIGASIIGYLSGSFVQGTQETWVRREETKIRAKLVHRIQSAFQKSIQIKTHSDNQLRQKASNQIINLLNRYGIPRPEQLVASTPIKEPIHINQRYFFEPTHRTVKFSGQEETQMASNPASPSHPKSPWPYIVFAAGVVGGWTLQGLHKLFTSTMFEGPPLNRKVIDNISAPGKEGMWLMGMNSRKNLVALTGFLTIAAGSKIGKLFIDGLREIEVTRANAETEHRYQTHNWLTLDPSFHAIAESEALNNDLRLFERDLPTLQHNRTLMANRIQTILANIGRNSAPKYFPMTPVVGLVAARG